jgi:hypothetical protein
LAAVCGTVQYVIAHVHGHDEKLAFRELDDHGHHQYKVYKK